MKKPRVNAVDMVRRIRDKQAKQFAGMSDKQLIAHLRKAGERSLAEARATRPVRRSRAG
jgi:hypothetical protein